MTTRKNIRRIRRAIVAEYAEAGNDEMIIDVLADLMHLANALHVDFAQALRTAYGHYFVESGVPVCESTLPYWRRELKGK